MFNYYFFLNLYLALWWTGVFLADKDDKRIAAYLM